MKINQVLRATYNEDEVKVVLSQMHPIKGLALMGCILSSTKLNLLAYHRVVGV